jgi:P-type Cu+ transporter
MASRRHQLLRFLIGSIVAIQNFLINVVWTSLVPPSHPTRIFFETNMWAGADTRAEWALFFLATPVMLLVVDVFRFRAIKEIRALWRGMAGPQLSEDFTILVA